jgi:hypothetical protein
MYGHGPLGQTLLEHQLLDELRLWFIRSLSVAARCSSEGAQTLP